MARPPQVTHSGIPERFRPRPGIRSRKYMFTWNNWNERSITMLEALGLLNSTQWIIYAKEVAPTTGTPHLQGFVLFKNDRFWTALVNSFKGCWWAPADGTPYSNYLYVIKKRPARQSREGVLLPADPTPNPLESITEIGQRPNFTPNEDRCNAANEAKKEMWDNALQSAKEGRWGDIPSQILIQHYRTLKLIYAESRSKLAPFTDYVLKTWQQKVVDIITGAPDPRKIYWIWEPIGNVGKSWLAMFLASNHDATVVSSGKTADIAYALDHPTTVVFDLSRTVAEHVNYGVMENIKNGLIFSSKYESTTKTFAVPHVIVFANWPPQHGVFSADRLHLWNLNDDSHTVTQINAPATALRSSTSAFTFPTATAELVSDDYVPIDFSFLDNDFNLPNNLAGPSSIANGVDPTGYITPPYTPRPDPESPPRFTRPRAYAMDISNNDSDIEEQPEDDDDLGSGYDI